MFKSKTNAVPITNSSCRKLWENKKQNLRIKMALFFVTFNVIGLELAAPGYSVTTIMSDLIIGNSSTLGEVLSNLPQILSSTFDIPIDIHMIAKKSIKWSFVILLSCITYYFICHKDPFSNLELLRTIHKKNISLKNFWLREIVFYAKYLPSNMLAKNCRQCSNEEECIRKIPDTGEEKQKAWCKIFEVLEPNHIEYWHKCTNECRKAYYLKYGFLFSSIFLLMVLGAIHFFIEDIIHSPIDNKLNIAWILLSLTGFTFVSLTHRTSEEKGGAWRKFKDKSICFFNDDKFKSIMKNTICWNISSDEEIDKIVIVNKYVDYIVEDKLVTQIYQKQEQKITRKSNIYRILHHVLASLRNISKQNASFRTTLFLLSSDNKELFPVVSISLKDSKYHCINENDASENTTNHFFAINGNSIAALAWRENSPISANANLNSVCLENPKHLQSILCFPLIFNDDVFLLLKERGKTDQRCFGVLCIDSDDIDFFSSQYTKINNAIVKPFAERVTYEFSLSLFHDENLFEST